MTRKIFRNVFFMGTLVLVICGVLFTVILQRRYEQQTFANLAEQALVLEQSMPYAPLPSLELEDRVTWITQDGTVLYDNRADWEQMDDHSGR